ncbi:MAG: hypothetical protein PHG83_00780 [Patescibacteria group bacterium]|nr:hypothetical protein [Patescibacteria group bacterium]
MKKFNKNIKFITYFAGIGSTLFLLTQKVTAQELYGPMQYSDPVIAKITFFRLSKILFLPIIFIIGIIFLIKRWRRNKKKLNAQKNSQSGKI